MGGTDHFSAQKPGTGVQIVATSDYLLRIVLQGLEQNTIIRPLSFSPSVQIYTAVQCLHLELFPKSLQVYRPFR